MGARYVLVGLPDDPRVKVRNWKPMMARTMPVSKARRVVCHLLGIKKGRDRLCQSVACS